MTKERSMRGSGNRMWPAAAFVLALGWPGIAVAASSVTGTVTFDGKAPALRPIAMDAEPVCAKKHTGPAPNEALVLGSGNTMANIMVYVSKGLPAGKTYPAPATPVTINQDGCVYKPHVLGIAAGQQAKLLNSAGILPNITRSPRSTPRSIAGSRRRSRR